MQNIHPMTLICYGGIALLVLALTVPIIASFFLIGKVTKREVENRQTKKDAYRQSIRDDGGVLGVGKIIDAKVIHRPRSREAQRNNPFVIDFEVELSPENVPAFRIKFRDEIFPNGYEVKLIPSEHDLENYQMVSEYGKKASVMYDPANPSRAYIDTYDLDNSHPARMIWRF